MSNCDCEPCKEMITAIKLILNSLDDFHPKQKHDILFSCMISNLVRAKFSKKEGTEMIQHGLDRFSNDEWDESIEVVEKQIKEMQKQKKKK